MTLLSMTTIATLFAGCICKV